MFRDKKKKLILIHIKLISHILTICLMKRVMNESGLGSVISSSEGIVKADRPDPMDSTSSPKSKEIMRSGCSMNSEDLMPRS